MQPTQDSAVRSCFRTDFSAKVHDTAQHKLVFAPTFEGLFTTSRSTMLISALTSERLCTTSRNKILFSHSLSGDSARHLVTRTGFRTCSLANVCFSPNGGISLSVPSPTAWRVSLVVRCMQHSTTPHSLLTSTSCNADRELWTTNDSTQYCMAC